jgi:hypothetical protein
MIRIINLATNKKKYEDWNSVSIYCGRPNPRIPNNAVTLFDLSNPYRIPQYTREESVRLFRVLFEKDVVTKGTKIRNAFAQLYRIYKQCNIERKDLVLMCWCAPQKCHTEILQEWLLKCEEIDKSKGA